MEVSKALRRAAEIGNGRGKFMADTAWENLNKLFPTLGISVLTNIKYNPNMDGVSITFKVSVWRGDELYIEEKYPAENFPPDELLVKMSLIA